MEPVRIGVVGRVSVGSTLGRRWAEAGHAVRFGTRDPERSDVRDLVAGIEGNAGAIEVDEAADADVLVLAVPANGSSRSSTGHADTVGRTCSNVVAATVRRYRSEAPVRQYDPDYALGSTGAAVSR